MWAITKNYPPLAALKVRGTIFDPPKTHTIGVSKKILWNSPLMIGENYTD